MIGRFWTELTPEMQAAVLQSAVTLLAGVVGVLVVFVQIGRQARHAIAQNRHNEALKLKLEIYKETLRIHDEAQDREIALSSYVRLFPIAIANARTLLVQGVTPTPPTNRVPQLIELKTRADEGAIGIVILTEKWQIIDPRLEIFRTAINVAKYDVDEAWRHYFEFAMHAHPVESPQGNIFPWTPLNDADLKTLQRKSDGLLEALGVLGSFVYDLRVEMQNALLGELFPTPLPARNPIDPKYMVVKLENHRQLADYFERDTPWGKNKARIEAEARARRNAA